MARPYKIYVVESEEYWYVGSAWATTPKQRFNAHITGNGGGTRLHPMIKLIGADKFSQRILEVGIGHPVHSPNTYDDRGKKQS